jgi:tRNA threonylcarbamoyladenosine biosynthesis protein TsaE
MVELGRLLGLRLRAGDVVLLHGDLGAGKTTLMRGIGEGMGVRGPVTSPTFVIARRHPSLVSGPDLVHADAYRLGSADEFEDLDLDADDAVVCVEWGGDRAEGLSDRRLEITIEACGEARLVTIAGVGREVPL